MLLESDCPWVLIRSLGWLDGATLLVSQAGSSSRVSHTIVEICGIGVGFMEESAE